MPNPSARLIFVDGAQKGQRCALDGESLTIGRERKNDLPIDDPGISRNHAAVVRVGRDLVLRDTGSTNGTFVNSRRIKEVVLRHGDRITVGDTVLLVEIVRQSEAPRVVVSEQAHDSSRDLRVELNSTALLPPGTVNLVEEEVRLQLFAIFEFSARITGVLDMDRLLPLALKELARIMGADRGAILFLDKSDNLAPRAVWPPDSGDVVISRTITDAVLASRQGLLSLPDAQSGLRNTVSISLRDVGAVLCAPLLAEDKALGVVYLDTKSSSAPFKERSLHLLGGVCVNLAVAIQNANLYRSLRNAEEFASSILKSLSSGLLVIDERAVVIRANEAAAEILHLSGRELAGAPLGQVPALRDVAPLILQTLQTGIPQEREEVTVMIDDKPVPLGLSTSLLEDYTARRIGVICSFRNLSRLKKLAEEVKRAQRLASLGEMAAGIAHEVRNPLNSVQGFAQLLQESAVKRNEKTETEYAGIIIEEVARINKIVQDLLDFSRQKELSLAPLDLMELVAGLYQQLKPQAQAAGVTLRLGSHPEKPLTVLGNLDKLKQLLLNLITNAIQACAAGGAVDLLLEKVKAANGVFTEAVIRVRDDGCGIAEKDREFIFNPFFTTKDIGTGLGLSICQRIAEQHSGRIEVESTLGLGSTFSLFLPRRE